VEEGEAIRWRKRLQKLLPIERAERCERCDLKRAEGRILGKLRDRSQLGARLRQQGMDGVKLCHCATIGLEIPGLCGRLLKLRYFGARIRRIFKPAINNKATRSNSNDVPHVPLFFRLENLRNTSNVCSGVATANLVTSFDERNAKLAPSLEHVTNEGEIPIFEQP